MRKTLPERYYLDHFHEFLQFFAGASDFLLSSRDRDFIGGFGQLDGDKQCVIARAANRKYAVINREHFNYQEIDSPQLQLDMLIEQGWFADIRTASLSDIGSVLTKPDIIRLLNGFGCTTSGGMKKADLLHQLLEQIRQNGWPASLNLDQYLVRQFDESLRYLLFLYFGHTRGRLNQFSMRDLGVMRTRSDADAAKARFETMADAQAAFFYATRLDQLGHADDDALLKAAREIFPQPHSISAVQLQEQYLFRLGTKLLVVCRKSAMDLLQLSPGDAAQEKWIREAYRDKERDAVQARLETIISNPPSDTLLLFAEDFYDRKFGKKRTSKLTDMLRSASRTIQIDESQNQAVEQGVINWYRRHNISAWRTENTLWRSLFGLTFWSLLFERESLVNEFDSRPLVLRNNNFYTQFAAEIEALLSDLHSGPQLLLRLSKTASAHYGKINSLFMWSERLLENLSVLLQHAPFPAVRQFLRLMSQDFHSLSDGFPDIMVLENSHLRFEEIKAPGDQLRRNQLVSIQRLQEAGFDVKITQVSWYRDPYQPYAVVDIETTGGNSSYDRITEIGVVKMIGGEVVDTWHSLINPQRRIPARITELTGISNEMVADAPVFAEVARSLQRFTEDSVFVAHNVNFDFGFLKQEFARVEQPFQRPKLCTVREMRKTRPGLPSYSLAALTAHFGIVMERHHRAMSDAHAAARLLAIIHDS